MFANNGFIPPHLKRTKVHSAELVELAIINGVYLKNYNNTLSYNLVEIKVSFINF